MTTGATRLIRTTVICCAATAHIAQTAGLAMPTPSLPLPASGWVWTTGSTTTIVARSRRIANLMNRMALRTHANPPEPDEIPIACRNRPLVAKRRQVASNRLIH